MISLNEKAYRVRCREADLELVQGVANKALEQYKATMKEEMGEVCCDYTSSASATQSHLHLPGFHKSQVCHVNEASDEN